MSEATQHEAPQTPAGGGEGQGGQRPERPRRRGGGRFGRRRVCAFCVDKINSIDYKEPAKLRRYVSDRGKIEPRRKTGTCAAQQQQTTTGQKVRLVGETLYQAGRWDQARRVVFKAAA